MIKNLKKTLASLLTGLLCCGLWMLPSSADACCIYNHTAYPLVAQFNMFSNHTIGPSNKFCNNGKGGTYTIFLQDRSQKRPISYDIRIKVDEHGWLSVYKKNDGKWKVVSHHKDGSVKETTHLLPTS